MAPALQAVSVIALVCQYSRVFPLPGRRFAKQICRKGPVCVAFATGPDEFRKQGSYRLSDLGGRDIGRSVLTLG